MDDENSIDYYSILNVARNSTSEEIKAAYHRFCVVFHPDKQIDLSKKEAAEKSFQQIQAAYDVLCDEGKRFIYDKYGIEGIKKSWQIGPHLNLAEKIKEELETQKLKKEEFLNSMGIKSQGAVVAYIDATSLFDSYGLDSVADLVPEFDAMNIQQSFQKELNPNTEIGLIFNLVSRNGNGNASMTCMLQHTIKDIKSQLLLGVGSNRFMSINASKPLSKFSWGEFNFNTNLGSFSPLYQFTCGRFITKSMTGTFSFLLGNETAIKLALKRSSTSGSFKIARDFVKIDCKGSISVGPKSSIKVKGTIGTVDLHCALGYSTQVTKKAVLTSSIETGTMFGVVLKFAVAFGNHSLVIPIFLSHQFSLKMTILGFIIPTTLGTISKKFVVDPLLLSKEEQELKEFMREREEMIVKRQNDAAEAVELMKAAVAKKIQMEEKCDGLIILEGLYGSSTKMIDVAIPLQFLVNNSQLLLHPHSKAFLVGFYDPCVEEEKELHIKYKFRSQVHAVKVADCDSLVAPLRSHIVFEEF